MDTFVITDNKHVPWTVGNLKANWKIYEGHLKAAGGLFDKLQANHLRWQLSLDWQI